MADALRLDVRDCRPPPELTNEQFGALITSDQPIAVERALYWDTSGQLWAAGSNASAARLP